MKYEMAAGLAKRSANGSKTGRAMTDGRGASAYPEGYWHDDSIATDYLASIL